MKKLILMNTLFLVITSFVSCGSDDVDVLVNANNFETSIDENPEMDQVIGTLIATTNQGVLNYSIISQTPMNALAINKLSGVITVKDPNAFDFETNSLIEADVMVSVGSVSDMVLARIALNDIDEGIFKGNVVITTQAELESFTALNYHTIDGDLTISDDTNVMDIGNMETLRILTSVTGVLKIENMVNILDLSGLENLIAVGGLTINNTELLDVEHISGLTSCNGPILITNNLSLEFYCGLQPLLKSGNFSDTFTVSGNFINPTIQDILDADCNK